MITEKYITALEKAAATAVAGLLPIFFIDTLWHILPAIVLLLLIYGREVGQEQAKTYSHDWSKWLLVNWSQGNRLDIAGAAAGVGLAFFIGLF